MKEHFKRGKICRSVWGINYLQPKKAFLMTSLPLFLKNMGWKFPAKLRTISLNGKRYKNPQITRRTLWWLLIKVFLQIFLVINMQVSKINLNQWLIQMNKKNHQIKKIVKIWIISPNSGNKSNKRLRMMNYLKTKKTRQMINKHKKL